MNKFLAIITPTYNRERTLSRTYNSLIRQNCREDFFWMIVDDGSIDNTARLVRKWQKEDLIDIVYIKQRNSGKHVAINTALDNLPSSDFVFILDSDDWLPDNAISLIKSAANETEPENIIGIIALKCDQNKNVLGTKYPLQHGPASMIELEREGLGGERSLVFRSDIIKCYRFNVYEGERFSTECNLYYQFEKDGFKYHVLSEVLTICEYQTDGLSSNPRKLMVLNPCGYVDYFSFRVQFEKKITDRVLNSIKLNSFLMLSNGKTKNLALGSRQLLVLLTKPLGILGMMYYKSSVK